MGLDPGDLHGALSKIDVFGKNEPVKRVFWALFVTMAGLVLARVVDPATAQQVVGIITAVIP